MVRRSLQYRMEIMLTITRASASAEKFVQTPSGCPGGMNAILAQ